MSKASTEGRMLAVGISSDEAEKAIAAYGDLVSLAAINSPNSVTLSGNAEQLKSLAEEFDQRQLFNKFVPVNYAFHSAHMDPIKDELLKALQVLTPKKAILPIVSTVTGKNVKGFEVLPSLSRKADEQETMLQSLGALHCLGYPIAWESLYEPDHHR